jgi:hypothetical protein
MSSSQSKAFLRLAGEQLASEHFAGFKHLRSKNTLIRERDGGADIIVLSAATQFSPCISMAFYVGRRFPGATEVEKKCGWQPSYYQIHQFSPNAHQMRELGYVGPSCWEVDLRNPQAGLNDELAAAVRGIGLPFFARFTSLRSTQTALAVGDSWCIGGQGPFWRQMFSVDCALNDLNHFRIWARSLDRFSMAQANMALGHVSQPPIE